jgi:hypothetical protein
LSERKELELLPHLSRGRVSGRTIECERPEHHALQGLRDVAHDLGWSRKVTRHDSRNRLEIGALKQALSRDQLIENSPHRIDVDASIDRFAAQLLRRHVLDLA